MHNSGIEFMDVGAAPPLWRPVHGRPLCQAGKPLQPLPTVCLVFPALLSAPSHSIRLPADGREGLVQAWGGDKGQERPLNGSFWHLWEPLIHPPQPHLLLHLSAVERSTSSSFPWLDSINPEQLTETFVYFRCTGSPAQPPLLALCST